MGTLCDHSVRTPSSLDTLVIRALPISVLTIMYKTWKHGDLRSGSPKTIKDMDIRRSSVQPSGSAAGEKLLILPQIAAKSQRQPLNNSIENKKELKEIIPNTLHRFPKVSVKNSEQFSGPLYGKLYPIPNRQKSAENKVNNSGSTDPGRSLLFEDEDQKLFSEKKGYKLSRLKSLETESEIPGDKVSYEDDIYQVLKKLRDSLGWKTELPKRNCQCQALVYAISDTGFDFAEQSQGRPDDGSFVYCLPRNRHRLSSRYNPYDLEVVPASSVGQSHPFWTASATNVTMYQCNNEGSSVSVATPVLWWLWERRIFNTVHDINFFAKFLFEKYFQLWRQNVGYKKLKDRSLQLQKRLFCVNDVLLRCLVHVNSLCEQARPSSPFADTSSSSGVLCLIELTNAIYSLEDFAQRVKCQSKKCLNQFKSLQANIASIVHQACSLVAEMEGIQWLPNPISEKGKRQSPPKHFKMVYSQIASWRKVLVYLGRFLQCIDYIIATMLGRLVKDSVKYLMKHLEASYNVRAHEIKKVNEYRVAGQEDNGSYTMAGSFSKEQRKDFVGLNRKKTRVISRAEELRKKKTVLTADEVMDEIRQMTEEYVFPIFSIDLKLGRNVSSGKESVAAQKDNNPQPEVVTPCTGLFLETTEICCSPEKPKSRGKRSGFFLQLSPSSEDFFKCIEDILESFENIIIEFVPMKQEQTLSPFYNPTFGEAHQFDVAKYIQTSEDEDLHKSGQFPWPYLDHLLWQDEEYQYILAKIRNFFKIQLKDIESFALEFTRYRRMVENSLSVDRVIFGSDMNFNPDKCSHILASQTEMLQLMNEMIVSQRFGMLQICSSEFYKSCTPYPTKVLNYICSRIPDMAQKKNIALLRKIKDNISSLEHEPVSVEECVEHLLLINQINHELTDLEQEFNVVNDFFSLIRLYEMEVNEESIALYYTLAPSFQHMKATLIASEATKEGKIEKFQEKLDLLITQTGSDVTALGMEIRDPELLTVSKSKTLALKKLQDLENDLRYQTNTLKDYSNSGEHLANHQREMKQQESEEELMESSKYLIVRLFKDLNELERDLGLRKLVIEADKEWNKLVADWMSIPFQDIDVDNLQKQMTRFTQTVYMLEKGLPPNELVPKLRESVLDFKQVMPVVLSLCNPSLKPRHWEQLEQIMGTRVDKDNSITLGILMEEQLFRFKDKIQEISSRASNEGTLETMLKKIINLWEMTNLKIIPHANSWIIVGVEDLLPLLEESQVTIATIRGSKYVVPIKATVEEWEKRLQTMLRTLDIWLICQRSWIYFEEIFGALDIQRQLPNEYRMFLKVDRKWRELMQCLRDDLNVPSAILRPGLHDTLQSSNMALDKIQKSLEDYLETKRLTFPRFFFLSNEELLDVLANCRDPIAIQRHLGKCFGNIHCLGIIFGERPPDNIVSMTSVEGETVSLSRVIKIFGPVEQWLGNLETIMFETVKRSLHLGLKDYGQIPLVDWLPKYPGQVILTVSQIIFSRSVQSAFSNINPSPALSTVLTNIVESLNILARVASTTMFTHQTMSIEALLTISVHNRDIVTSLIENTITSATDFQWTRQLRYEWLEPPGICQVEQSTFSFPYGYEYLGCSSRLVITPLTDRCYLTLTGAMQLNLGGSPSGPAGTGKSETVKDLAKVMGKQCVVFNCSEGLDYKMLSKFFSGLILSGSWCCFDEFNRIGVEVLSVVSQQLQTIKSAKDTHAVRFVFDGQELKLNPTCGFFITMNPTYAGRVELPDNLKALFRPVAMMVPDYALIAEIMLFSQGFENAKTLSQKIINLYQLASRQLSQQDHYDFGMRAIKSVLMMAGQARKQESRRVAAEGQVLSEKDESNLLISSLRDANLPKFLTEDLPLFENILTDLFPNITPDPVQSKSLEKAIRGALREFGLQICEKQVSKVKQLYYQILVRDGVMLVGPADGGKTTVRNVLHRALDIMQTNIFQALGKKGKKNLLEAVNINPKCVTLQALYGWTDPETFEWTDGLLASTIRNFAASFLAKTKSYASQEGQENGQSPNSTFDSGSDQTDPPKWKWLILDGPVDTLWVENLNTVLDDSRVLCLANGERVNIASGMRFLFEVDSLSQASPATISRCAMIYMDPVDLGWKPFVTSWFQRLDKQFPEEGRQYLETLFEASVDPVLKFLSTHHRHIWHESSELRTVVSLCNILFALLDHVANNGGFGNEEKQNEIEPPPLKGCDSKLSPQRLGLSPRSSAKSLDSTVDKTYLQKNPNSLRDVLGKLFVFALTWSFGNVFKRFEDDDKPEDSLATEFDALVRDLFENSELGIRLPRGDQNIYKYFLNLNSNEFTSWVSLVHSTDVEIEKRGLHTLQLGGPNNHQPRGTMDNQLVLTEEFIGFSFVISLLLLNGQPVLLTGDAGSGKSILIKYILGELEKGVNKSDEKDILGRIFAYKKEKGLFNQHENLSFLLASDVHSDYGTIYDDDDNDDDDESCSKTREPEMVVSETCCSAQMTAARLQENLCSKLINRGGNSLGALKGKKVVVFVDDVNMPSADEFGSHPPLELLRQVVERKGFYESKNLAWKSVCDVTLVTAAGPPGGGRSVLSPRLLKHFCILGLPEPSSQSLRYIYQVELGSFFKQGSFMPEVLSLRLPLVSACIQLYHMISNSLKPTPRKSHYVFNLRDISKVVQGLLQADDSVVINKNVCLQLFVHETMRVFHDRLVDTEDKAMFFNHLTQIIQDNFKRNWTLSPKDFVIFGDFFEENQTKKIYRPISDQDKLIQILENYRLKMTLGSERVMQIVFFKEAVQHIMRATRVLRQKGGHLLMVGYDGTGKSLVSKFATFISGYQLYRLQLHRSYGTEELHEDIKKVFQQCGVQGIKTVLLISDQDIVKESFLEDINSILNSGEVSGLFDADELEGLLMSLKPLANEANISETKQGLYSFFIQRVQRNLHVALSMNVRSGMFHHRCRVNPALINCCTIDWYDIWDREAMLNVASAFFSDSGITSFEDHETRLSSQLKMQKPNLVESCVQIYDSVLSMSEVYWSEMRSQVYFTPADYMEFVQLYSRLTCQSKKEHMDCRNRLQNGIQTIVDTNASVAEMKEDLVTLGPKIEEKAKETDSLLSVLTENQIDVEQVQQIVEEDERIMKMEAKIIQDYAQECTNDLESVLPELRNAQIALSHLDKASISELRVYIKPPQLVIEVMSAVCVLFQKDPTWKNAILMLADLNFLKQLIEFDKDSVTNRVLAKLRTYTQKKEFNPKIVARVSIACKSICQWLLALEQYYAVIKMVKPKQKKLAAAEEALKMAEKRLASKQESLKKVQNHWKTIQEEYDSKVNERESLKKRKELIASRLKIAGLLIAALADEEDRWLEAIHSVNAKLVCLLGDNLIGSAAVCFAGSFTSKYRSLLIKKWKDICRDYHLQISENFDIIKNMVYDQQILNWNSQGLPRNSHSVENAILMTKNRKWPLFIDPEGQATKWIKQAEGRKLKVASAENPSYMRTVERCLRMGDPLLLTDVGESLDPALRPILTMDTFHQGGTKMIKLGETAIEYNDHFKLYLVSSLNKPHFLPPVGILVNIINFTVTVDALKEHLLSTLIMEEKPDLEKQRITLLSSITSDKQMLRELEDKSLLLLQKSEKHILDDEDLVENLQMSRDTAQEIYRRVSESEEAEKQNQTARTAYVSVATRGTVLYFTLVEMSQVDSMYQFSLGWFQDMFKECINPPPRVQSLGKFVNAMTLKALKPTTQPKTEKTSLQTHLTEIINRLTSSVYRVVSRSLFACHQQIFSFLLCTNIMRMNGKLQGEEKTVATDEGIDVISEIEWQIFLQGNILAKMEEKASKQNELSQESKRFPSWISDTTSLQCELISRTFPVFQSLCSSLISNPNQWNSFRQSHSPLLLMKEHFVPHAEDHSPSDTEIFPWENLSSFQKLILIKILCPESLIGCIKEFISNQMGDHYLSFGGFDLKDVYQESSCSIPLIFILSPGCDPAMKLLKFAKDLKGSHRHLDMVSLGRGQGSKAEELINRAQMQNGRWVFLQNCHLAASWMPQLQTILEKLNSIPIEQRDPNFRLWLSSKPDPFFPVQILQKGIKMIIESPSGLKAGMQRCFDVSGSGTVTPEMFDDESMTAGVGSGVWKKLLFGLCLFNNIIHERKKYGTLGWNIPYEFNDSDLQVSIQHLHMLLSENQTVPWSALTYLTGEVNYGGRVTDDQDRLCLENILTTFFCPDAISQNYIYSPDGVYETLPDGITFEDVVNLISTFPSKTSVNLFGMSEDAEIACQQLRAQSLVDTLTSVQPAISSTFGGSKQSTDNMVFELCDEIRSKLPVTVETLRPMATKMAARFFKEVTLRNFLQKNFHSDNSYITPEKITIMSKTINKVLGNSPLVIQLQQELDIFNHLLELIHNALGHLKLAISGEIIMSSQLEDIYHSILTQQVPERFKKASYESCQPLGEWVTDLFQRIQFFFHWSSRLMEEVERRYTTQTKGSSGLAASQSYCYPGSYWLPAFSFPQGFLTAVLQTHARKLSMSIDLLEFGFELIMEKFSNAKNLQEMKHNTDICHTAFRDMNPPEEGVLIFGLYLDSAMLNPETKLLCQSPPRKRFCGMPHIHLRPKLRTCSQTESNPSKTIKEETTMYNCPVYRTMARSGSLTGAGLSTNYVMSILLPTDQPPRVWILRGAALLCQISDD